jgi:hypothetical protein
LLLAKYPLKKKVVVVTALFVEQSSINVWEKY